MTNRSHFIGAAALVVLLGVVVFLATKHATSEPYSERLVQSNLAYVLKSDSQVKTYAANTPGEYAFSIVDSQGKTLKDFAITHTKPMHVIVVRKDLASFQHVHPEHDQATGIFTLKDFSFPADGQYRIFADFSPTGTSSAVTVSEDLSVGTNYAPQSIGSEKYVKNVDGYQIYLATHGALSSSAESMLMFTISQNGDLVTDLEEYLGALGHSGLLESKWNSG